MARKQKAPVITVKMYKQFAIATVLITGAIALMADGEKREAIANEVTNLDIEGLEQEKPKLIVRKDAPRQDQDMSGFYGNTGSDTSSIAGSESGIIPGSNPVEEMGAKKGREHLSRAGLTEAEFEALSDEEKRRVLEMLNKGDASEKGPEQMEALIQQSQARSGGNSADR